MSLKNLVQAAKAGDLKLCSAMLKAGADPNMDYKGMRPLHAAAQSSRKAVELLLAAGADPNGRDCAGQTPLHYAAFACDVASVRSLLAAGADPQAKDIFATRPVDLTHRFGTEAGMATLKALLGEG